MSRMKPLAIALAALTFTMGALTARAESVTEDSNEVDAPVLIQGRLLGFRFASDEAEVQLAPGVNPVPGMAVSFANATPTAVLIHFCAEVVDDGSLGAFMRLQAQVDGIDAEPDDFLVVHSENTVGVPQRRASCFTWAFPGVAPGIHEVTILASPNNGTFTMDERTLTAQFLR